MVLNIVTQSKSVNTGRLKSQIKILQKSFKDMIIDSLVIGGIACFSIWTGEPTIEQLFIIAKAFGLSFLIQLGYERGIKKLIN